jgi:transposase-like protein
MSEKRRQWTGEQILALLKRHLVDKVELSRICEEEQISPSQLYRWQAQLFVEGAAVFQRKNGQGERRERLEALQKISALEEKLQTKNEVLSELMEEHVKLKKELGEN